MTSQVQAVFGIFDGRVALNSLKNKLHLFGFSDSEIIILYPSNRKQLDIELLQTNMILLFAKIGSIAGGILFFLLGLLITSDYLNMKGSFDRLLLGDILIISLLFIFGIFFGAASGALIGIGTPHKVVLRFSHYIDAGGILISVRVETARDKDIATLLLQSFGVRDLKVLSETDVWSAVHRCQLVAA